MKLLLFLTFSDLSIAPCVIKGSGANFLIGVLCFGVMEIPFLAFKLINRWYSNSKNHNDVTYKSWCTFFKNVKLGMDDPISV